MTTDPLALMGEVDRATDRMLRTAATLDDAAVAAPSPLPGWTRGHVLTHLARNADGLGNLLHLGPHRDRDPAVRRARRSGTPTSRPGAARPRPSSSPT